MGDSSNSKTALESPYSTATVPGLLVVVVVALVAVTSAAPNEL